MRLNEMMHEYPVCCDEFETAQRAAELMKEQAPACCRSLKRIRRES